MKAHTLDLDPRVGFENMRTLASIRDDASREKAQDELRGGHSPDMVKARYGGKREQKDRRAVLLDERTRIEKNIERLKKRLTEIEKRIAEMGKE
jgi:hypothetical protein